MNAGSERTSDVDGSGPDPLRLLDDYAFDLPDALIAQHPTAGREDARLMVIDRDSGAVVESSVEHRVSALPDWLRSGDLLVVNVTRVLPARLVGHKRSGGRAEALLLGIEPGDDAAPGLFRALVKSRGRLRVGLEFEFGNATTLPATLVAIHERGEVTLRFPIDADPYAQGFAPLPPYIKRGPGDGTQTSPGPAESDLDLERYQTVYARAPGAVAAPTAGLHLSLPLLDRLRAKGVEVAEVVLHVGAGTFRPLDREALESGRLHAERFELPEETATAIARARARGGRIVAVGTTTTRVLETRADGLGGVHAGAGWTDLFLRPGAGSIRVVDALLTNFHLPRSSLLLLVATFVEREALLAAYAKAVEAEFRFFSYGDAMLILGELQASSRG